MTVVDLGSLSTTDSNIGTLSGNDAYITLKSVSDSVNNFCSSSGKKLQGDAWNSVRTRLSVYPLIIESRTTLARNMFVDMKTAVGILDAYLAKSSKYTRLDTADFKKVDEDLSNVKGQIARFVYQRNALDKNADNYKEEYNKWSRYIASSEKTRDELQEYWNLLFHLEDTDKNAAGKMDNVSRMMSKAEGSTDVGGNFHDTVGALQAENAFEPKNETPEQKDGNAKDEPKADETKGVDAAQATDAAPASQAAGTEGNESKNETPEQKDGNAKEEPKADETKGDNVTITKNDDGTTKIEYPNENGAIVTQVNDSNGKEIERMTVNSDGSKEHYYIDPETKNARLETTEADGTRTEKKYFGSAEEETTYYNEFDKNTSGYSKSETTRYDDGTSTRIDYKTDGSSIAYDYDGEELTSVTYNNSDNSFKEWVYTNGKVTEEYIGSPDGTIEKYAIDENGKRTYVGLDERG